MFEADGYDALLEDIKLQEANCQPFFDSVKDQEALDAREEAHRQRSLLLLKKFEESSLEMQEIRDIKPDDLAGIHYPSVRYFIISPLKCNDIMQSCLTDNTRKLLAHISSNARYDQTCQSPN